MDPWGRDELFRKPDEDESLHPTWWLLDDESDDLNDIMTQAGTSLKDMFDLYKIKPVEFDSQQKLFVARFEFPTYQQDLQYPDAKFKNVKKCRGWADFLCGFPSLGAAEMLVIVGEWSSKQDKTDGYVEAIEAAADDPSPPFPDDLFTGYRDNRVLSNYLFIGDPNDAGDRDIFVDGVKGEPEPTGLHWWSRINVTDDNKSPVPGEFLGMAVRQWLDLPWGQQGSSPYLFSGHWMDTVYYTSGKVLAVNSPTDDRAFYTYTVTWRKFTLENVTSTDFNVYAVGDMVTIIKDVATDKASQLWKDDDMKAVPQSDSTRWMIAPVMFYDIKNQKETE